MIKKGKWQKVLLTSLMVGSLLSVGTTAQAEGKQATTVNISTQLAVADLSSYNDFDANASWWAPEMQWAISEGILSGYKNQVHPSDPKKSIGNWLDPYGYVTEQQMLTILLNYLEPELYENAKETTSQQDLHTNSAFAEYKLANDLGIVTRGSTSNATLASQHVTRGQMARALVSYIYGRSVTMEQAIKFMYENNFTSGTNPSKGQTLDNFNVTDKLTRVQLVIFLNRYVMQDELKDTLYSSMHAEYEAKQIEWVNKIQLVWGDNEPGYETKETAEADMTQITVPVWKVNSKGIKVKSQATITVHKNLTEVYTAIFQEIFDGPEKFPIKDVGGYSWRMNNPTSEHRQGTAIDINANENMFASIDEDGNVTKILVGSFWKPYENIYSIPEDGDVVRAFKKHGFTWGGDAWPNSRDYMHFSYFGR